MSTTEPPLNRATLNAADPSDHLTDLLALPEHLRDALWKVESAGLRGWDSPDGMVIAGMGQSAMGGMLARAALGDHASRPVLHARAYGLPPWTTPETTVLCASYSGETEETLACYEAAGTLGAPRVVVTAGGTLAREARADGVPVIPVAGGLRPSTSVAYFTVAALEVAAVCGIGPRLTSEIDVAAEHLEELVVKWGADSPEDRGPKALARALRGTIPVIAGAGLTAVVAERWKAQLNTMARVPAFASELPELNHHELAGWEGCEELGRFTAVFLDDSDTHPRVKARIALTREMVQTHCTGAHVVDTVGQTGIERALSLVLYGDLVAYYLAVLRGIDPAGATPVDALKGELKAT
jgi:glucose/mannose-6-phosphate isomerase